MRGAVVICVIQELSGIGFFYLNRRNRGVYAAANISSGTVVECTSIDVQPLCVSIGHFDGAAIFCLTIIEFAILDCHVPHGAHDRSAIAAVISSASFKQAISDREPTIGVVVTNIAFSAA